MLLHDFIRLLFDCVHVFTCKKHLRILRKQGDRRIQSELRHFFKVTRIRIQFSEYLGGGLRHKRFEKRRADGDGFHQIIKDGCQPVFLCLVFGQHPRLCLVNILVTTLKECKDFRERVRNTQLVHLFFYQFVTARHNAF